MRHHFGRFPILQFAMLDFIRHLTQDGIGDGFLAGGHADLRQLDLPLKARAAGALMRNFMAEDFDRLLEIDGTPRLQTLDVILVDRSLDAMLKAAAE